MRENAVNKINSKLDFAEERWVDLAEMAQMGKVFATQSWCLVRSIPQTQGKVKGGKGGHKMSSHLHMCTFGTGVQNKNKTDIK